MFTTVRVRRTFSKYSALKYLNVFENIICFFLRIRSDSLSAGREETGSGLSRKRIKYAYTNRIWIWTAVRAFAKRTSFPLVLQPINKYSWLEPRDDRNPYLKLKDRKNYNCNFKRTRIIKSFVRIL